MSQSILKNIFNSVILISAATKSYDFQNVIILMNTTYNISYYVANILLGSFITVEIVVCILVWNGSYQISLVYHTILFLLITFISVNVLFVISGIDNCGCYGTIISVSPVISLIKCILLLVILIYLRNKRVNCMHVKV